MSGPRLNSDPFRVERVEAVPPPEANGSVRLRPGNEPRAVPSDGRDGQPVLHDRDRSSHLHRLGSMGKERGKIANLRGLVRDRLGHHCLTDRPGLELIGSYVVEKPLSAAELFSATYIEVEPWEERPETPIDTSRYGILPFDAKGQHHGLWQVRKALAPSDIQDLMLNHVAWFPDDPVSLPVRESVELGRNGRWQRSPLALDTPGYFSFGLGTTAYHVDEDRLADNGQARYVNIGTPRSPSFIRLRDLRPFVDEDYAGMADVERFSALPEKSGEVDTSSLTRPFSVPKRSWVTPSLQTAASRHCLVKGVTASLPELEQAGLLDTPGFVGAMTKIPLINFQLATMSSTGSAVPHRIANENYARILDRLHVDDPRSMDTSTTSRAAEAIATSAYVSSCLFALGSQQV